jgi:hypothetical protein
LFAAHHAESYGRFHALLEGNSLSWAWHSLGQTQTDKGIKVSSSGGADVAQRSGTGSHCRDRGVVLELRCGFLEKDMVKKSLTWKCQLVS